ncbi:MAG: GGDEF domain-containing protein, partial [Nanoarchaeota archaeon]|nr:GGDEF domain-containing protein [Nanoarchaeota archaeon]
VELKSPLSVALLDIDDFKHYNDTHGHVKGDSLLKEIAEIVKKETRATDVVGRYGGEEFIIISPNTNSSVALDLVENVRTNIEENNFDGREEQPLGKITISAGLVTCTDKSLSDIELIREADRFLYKAKADGKNIVKSKVIVDKDLDHIDVQEVNNFQNNS